MNFDVLAQSERVHIANQKWWHDLEGNPIKRNKGEQLMLVISELSEAMEGARKNKMDDHLSHRKMLEVEIADALIRLLDYRWGHQHRSTFEVLSVPSADTSNIGSVLFVLCGNVRRIVRLDTNVDDLSQLDWVINSLFWFAEAFDLDLLGAYEEKMAYNAVRKDHTLEARAAEEGKKW